MAHLSIAQNLLAIGGGAVIGWLLLTVGGGGSTLAVPFMMDIVGIKNLQVATGTTAMFVAVTALASVLPHWRQGHVRIPIALGFAIPGVLGITVGASLGSFFSRSGMLIGFAGLTLTNAIFILGIKTPDSTVLPPAPPSHRWSYWVKVASLGLGVGIAVGIFGVGGGFMVMPGMLASGVPMMAAVGSSLLSVGSLGTWNAIRYALQGWINWHLVLDYLSGSIIGQILGSPLSKRISQHQGGVKFVVVALMIGASLLILSQNLSHLVG